MLKFNFFSGLMLLLALFSSCKEEKTEEPTPEVTAQDCRLSKVLDQNNNPVIEITYNSNNQVATFLNHTSTDLFTYTYSNGKLATANHVHTKASVGDFNQTYTINTDGLVTRQDFISPANPNNHLYWTFNYDNENRISRYQLYHIGSNGNPDNFRARAWFQYNADGNNEKELITNNSASEQDTVGYGYIYEFDKKPNPFYPIRGLPSNIDYSKNNPTKVIQTRYDSDGILTSQTLYGNYQNEYNKDGLLVKSTFTPTDGSGNVIRKYEYICN